MSAPEANLDFENISVSSAGRAQTMWRVAPLDGAAFAYAYPATIPASLAGPDCVHLAFYPPEHAGSVYIPLDNWIYSAITRLYQLGYVDTAFLALRPWTRASVLHMLLESQCDVVQGDSSEAKDILAVILSELNNEREDDQGVRHTVQGLESAYSRLMGVQGSALRDSFHLGQTVVNDYGRPYQRGFNAIAGFSSIVESGRFSLYVRGEYQHSPDATGYSAALANQLSIADSIGPYTPPNAPQATIPTGLIAELDSFRLTEGNLSYHLLGHEISIGKSDAWLGPAMGGAMAWSNNAEDTYSFRINRVEPLSLPLLSRLMGPVRYDFFYASLKGHTDPNSPFVHSEALSFQPTSNLQLGFQRTIIFGGKGHEPVTLHTFLKGFFSSSNTSTAEKFSRSDPGARFSTFSASCRLPYLRQYASFYVDSLVHDDVSPVDAPRRAGFRTGVDISQVPGMRKLELRVEAVSTDPGVTRSTGGDFLYAEEVQRQGYTNKGYIMGDWIGREAKGGQAWLTYHMSPKEWIQLEYLNKKQPKDFDGGTTQHQFKLSVVKRFHLRYELNAWAQFERWRAPIYRQGIQSDSIAAVQITWFPELKSGISIVHSRPLVRD